MIATRCHHGTFGCRWQGVHVCATAPQDDKPVCESSTLRESHSGAVNLRTAQDGSEVWLCHRHFDERRVRGEKIATAKGTHLVLVQRGTL